MALFAYNIFLFLYNIAISISSLWNDKAGAWKKGRTGIFKRITEAVGGHKNIVWFHCASLGEFEQGRPVMEEIRKKWPAVKMLLTFFSPSGYEVRKNYEGADFVFYLPMDSRSNAKKMVDIIKPIAVIFVKYEFWYHYLHEINSRKIPLILISAVFRKGQPFFKWWGTIHRRMLSFFSMIFVQDEQSANLLKDSEIKVNCTVSGDTRFDRVIEVAATASDIPVIDQFSSNCKLLVAGSTWKEDEQLLNSVFLESMKGIKLIIAPHDINSKRINEVSSIFNNVILYSDLANKGLDGRNPSVLIIDNIGMLSKLYKYGYINYVGGGFTSDGVHNVLEAAVYSVPVLFGPNYSKYREAVELVQTGGAFSVPNDIIFRNLLQSFHEDGIAYNDAGEKAGNYVRSRGGATDSILSYLEQEVLKNEV